MNNIDDIIFQMGIDAKRAVSINHPDKAMKILSAAVHHAYYIATYAYVIPTRIRQWRNPNAPYRNGCAPAILGTLFTVPLLETMFFYNVEHPELFLALPITNAISGVYEWYRHSKNELTKHEQMKELKGE
jgi:hypothetical protein